MPQSKSHSFSTRTEEETRFVEDLKISERKKGRANFSWVIVKALRDYNEKIRKQEAS